MRPPVPPTSPDQPDRFAGASAGSATRRPVPSGLMLPVWLSLALALLASGPVAAEEAEARLAPPGACAEPREALAGGGGSGFSVVGPVSTLFGPASVAAGPQALRTVAPSPPATVRPGPCDQPGAGCAPLATVSITNPPLVPGPRPTPEPLLVDPKHPSHPHTKHAYPGSPHWRENGNRGRDKDR